MIGLFLAAVLAAPAAQPASGRAVSLMKTLVEMDTTLATGSCTIAAEALRDVLAKAGFPAQDLHLFLDPAHPREGGLVAVLPGRSKAGALLFVSHLDTVEADPREWTHPPYELTEDAGYYHGRGVIDAKGVTALLVDTLIRLRESRASPHRSVKLALTCGEESPQAFNGMAWLTTRQRDLIDAEMALVPSGGAILDPAGRPVSIAVAAGEKVQQVYRIEARGDGSHASRPTSNNAIYGLAEALLRLRTLRFPIRILDTARIQLRDESAGTPHQQAVERLLQDPSEAAAAGLTPAWNAIVRTTCTPTVVDTGRQSNTVASRASALLNCRLLPGENPAVVESRLRTLLQDVATVTPLPPPAASVAPPPPLRQMASVTRIAAQIWPGVAVRSTLLTGATDARHLNAVGIPAYGLTVIFTDPDGNGVHGANERVRVRSFVQAGAFLHHLVRTIGDTPE